MASIAACDCANLLAALRRLMVQGHHPIEGLVVKVRFLRTHLLVAAKEPEGDLIDEAITDVCQELYDSMCHVENVVNLPVWKKVVSQRRAREAFAAIELCINAAQKALESAYQLSSYWLAMGLLEDARRQQELSASSPLVPVGVRVRKFIEIDPKTWEKTVMLRQALKERLAAFVRVTSPESRMTAINFLLATGGLQEDSNDHGGAGETHFLVASLQGQGSPEEVESSVHGYIRALANYEKQHAEGRNPMRIAEIHYRLGNTYAWLPIPNEVRAIGYLKTALPLYEKLKIPGAVAKIHVDLADCLPPERKWEAVSHLIKARDYYHSKKNFFCEGEMWLELAINVVFRDDLGFRSHAMNMGISKLKGTPIEQHEAARAFRLRYIETNSRLDPRERPVDQDSDTENRPIYFDPQYFHSPCDGVDDWRYTPYTFRASSPAYRRYFPSK